MLQYFIQMKKINITSLLLLVYLIVMSVMGWPGNKPNPDYKSYFLIMGISVAAILLLRYVQIRRMKFRNKQKDNE